MIADPESLAGELRYLLGIKDVDIVQFPSGKELWVVLKGPVDPEKLRKVSHTLGYTMTMVGRFSSKLPPSLGEMIWDGLMYVIRKEMHSDEKPKPAAGNAPVAKIMKDLATRDIIFVVSESDGLKILQEYLKS